VGHSGLPVLKEIEVTVPSCLNDSTCSSALILYIIIDPSSNPTAITSTTGDWAKVVIGEENGENV